MKRFINADIIPGKISNAVTLNRFAYANGNPVSLIDPFGLAPQSQLAYTTMVDETQKHSVYAGEMNDPGGLITYEKHSVSDVLDCCYDTIVDVSSAVLDWFEEAGEWLNKNARNKDGSYALYDNQRLDKNAVFHEQILAVTPSGPSFDLTTGNIGLGSLEVDAFTGGWEGEHANLSLFDFGHAEASLEVKDYQISVGAFASAWSPSFSVTVSGVTFEIGAEVGAVGVLGELGAHGAKLRISKAVGFTIGLTW